VLPLRETQSVSRNTSIEGAPRSDPHPVSDRPDISLEANAMTTTNPAALTTALAYHEAWTGKDLDRAMGYVADDIVCEAPGGNVVGADAYRQFLGGFMAKLTGVEIVAEFGDDTTAVLVYYPHTQVVSDAPTAECFTVVDEKITHSVLIFDRPSSAPPAA
jgi:SnoaL-like domain